MTWEKSKINLDRLSYEIQNMSVRSKLYKVLKKELTQLDYWKNKKRGKPSPNYGWRK
jgi:predicted ArsR family transcriptional regulator